MFQVILFKRKLQFPFCQLPYIRQNSSESKIKERRILYKDPKNKHHVNTAQVCTKSNGFEKSRKQNINTFSKINRQM